MVKSPGEVFGWCSSGSEVRRVAGGRMDPRFVERDDAHRDFCGDDGGGPGAASGCASRRFAVGRVLARTERARCPRSQVARSFGHISNPSSLPPVTVVEASPLISFLKADRFDIVESLGGEFVGASHVRVVL